MSDYSKNFSESGFFEFARKYAKQFGPVGDALAMFCCLMDADTPGWVKVAIVAALGYLICPIDAVPDFIPIGGLLDDAGVIAVALASIGSHIKPEHRAKAREFFGE